MKINVAMVPNENGGFTVYVPSLIGCISEGSTKSEALENIKEAIALYLEEVEDDSLFEESILDEVLV